MGGDSEPAPTTLAAEGIHEKPALSERLPALTFAAVEAVAFVYYLSLARTQWFFGDEWDFLAGRGLNIHDLLRAHYGHWVALPLVIYRVLWAVIGLRSYVPYVAITIALHLTAAALLRVIMQRAGVRPWIATVVASAFALFGAGGQDLLWAFQVTFTGALVLGLTQLLLADHDGGIDRRDWLGVVAGLLALMCSGVAVTMAIIVGLQVFLRRGWRAAAFHAVPLGVVYVAWWAAYSHGDYTFGGTPRQIFDWTVSGVGGLFDALGQVEGFGYAVAFVLVCGFVLAVRSRGVSALRGELSIPLAAVLGAMAFLVIAGYDRGSLGASFARSSRYVHILAALVIPAIGVAIDTILRRSKWIGAVALAVLLVGIPGNLLYVRDRAHGDQARASATRQLMLSLPRLSLARHVPRELRPEPNLASQVTVGWLLDALGSGRLPTTRPPGRARALANRLRLSVMELDRSSSYACRTFSTRTNLRLNAGDEVGLGRGRVLVVLFASGERSAPVSFGHALLNPAPTHTLVVVKGPLALTLIPVRTGSELCTPNPR